MPEPTNNQEGDTRGNVQRQTGGASPIKPPKVGKSASPFSFFNLFKPKSVTKIPKAPGGIGSKPQAKIAPTTIRPPKVGKMSRKKLLILVMIIPFTIIIVLVVALLIKGRPEEEVGQRGKLVWWGQREEEFVQPLIDKFEDENPDIKIEYQRQNPIDYRIRLQNLIDRGEAPDLFTLHSSWVPMFVRSLDVLPSNMMSQEEYGETFYPAIVGSLTTGSGIVGIPLGYDALVLYINQDLFTTAFAEPPKNWNDFSSLAEFLTSAPDDRIIQAGAAMGLTENVNHWEEIIALLMIQNGVDLNKPAGQRAEDVLNFYASFATFRNRNRVWDNTLPESVIAFANNNLAMLIAPTYRSNDIRRINPNLRFITVPVPQVPKAEPEDPDVSYATYWFEGVWSRTVNKDIAWRFLKFMTTEENLIIFSDSYRSRSLFPEISPRKDMGLNLKEDPVLGSAIVLSEHTRGWYLASDTNDGENGINTLLADIYGSAIASKTESGGRREVMGGVAEGVQSVLSGYGLAPRTLLPQ